MQVCDKGVYLGLQRKINLSGDEYVFFGPGTDCEVFDIGDLRFGITICCASGPARPCASRIRSRSAAAASALPNNSLHYESTTADDSLFPELALVHALNKTDLVLCPNAARSVYSGVRKSRRALPSPLLPPPPVPPACTPTCLATVWCSCC